MIGKSTKYVKRDVLFVSLCELYIECNTAKTENPINNELNVL